MAVGMRTIMNTWTSTRERWMREHECSCILGIYPISRTSRNRVHHGDRRGLFGKRRHYREG
ncbi:hypothetical protein HMPREF9565_01283 [Cutibacterium acnes HL053PA2]|nr:hypothetical protein HMPREF9565_01283 [Cutibacterium acnes HL053PA2]